MTLIIKISLTSLRFLTFLRIKDESHDSSLINIGRKLELRQQIIHKTEANVLYKSKFRIAITEGQTIDFVVKGRGTFDEEMEKK